MTKEQDWKEEIWSKLHRKYGVSLTSKEQFYEIINLAEEHNKKEMDNFFKERLTPDASITIEEYKKKFPDFYAWLIRNGFIYKKEFDRGQVRNELKEKDKQISNLKADNKRLHDIIDDMKNEGNFPCYYTTEPTKDDCKKCNAKVCMEKKNKQLEGDE
jgi:hypothetical protein